MKKYIAYYRVSTKEQGDSNLGIEAQIETVKRKIEKSGGILEAEYTEIESGTNNDRQIIKKALAKVKEVNGVLLIAKLDRLSRNVTFISTLIDNKVKFECCDLPDANEMTIHIFASIAQHEAKKISERTKDALSALKARGVKLGNPKYFSNEGRMKGGEAKRNQSLNNSNNKMIRELCVLQKNNNKTLTEIANYLNEKGFRTLNGGKYFAQQISRLLKQEEFLVNNYRFDV